MDLSASYWNNVFSPSLDQWTRGLTPNPDVMCNREIKFGELLRRLDQTASTPQAAVDPRAFGRRQTKRWLVTGELDLQEMQATIAIAYFSPRSQYEGHYAGLQYYHPTSKPSAVHGRLLRALDRTKDQSYFLSAVSSDQLGRTHFPLSWMTKVEVRELARTLGMPTAESEESMGLCFVGERKGGASAKENPARRRQADTVGENGFAGFLGDYIKSSPGDIVALDGQVVGRHGGLHTLTIGQGAKLSGRKEKFFVAAKQPQLNQVVVVPGNDHAWLQCHSLQVSSFTFIDQDQGAVALQSDNILAQIRHRQGAVPCQATSVGGSLTVHFTPAILAVAEGQVCALYKGEECLGSGVITNVETEASRTAKEVIMTTQ
jgi:tRNA U34 2-thiouridine synthase MnmA/TrmU